MPTYSAPRKVEVILYDDDGSKRIAVAERDRGYSNLPRWNMALGHPSGRSWPAQFSGSNIGDALFELLARKEDEYYQERGRGHRPQPGLPDRNVPIRDDGSFSRADLTDTKGRPIAFGKAAAADARAQAAEAMAKGRR
jgi:hypothetical protein